jgi:hypothetical protein
MASRRCSFIRLQRVWGALPQAATRRPVEGLEQVKSAGPRFVADRHRDGRIRPSLRPDQVADVVVRARGVREQVGEVLLALSEPREAIAQVAQPPVGVGGIGITAGGELLPRVGALIEVAAHGLEVVVPHRTQEAFEDFLLLIEVRGETLDERVEALEGEFQRLHLLFEVLDERVALLLDALPREVDARLLGRDVAGKVLGDEVFRPPGHVLDQVIEVGLFLGDVLLQRAKALFQVAEDRLERRSLCLEMDLEPGGLLLELPLRLLEEYPLVADLLFEDADAFRPDVRHGSRWLLAAWPVVLRSHARHSHPPCRWTSF